MMKSRRQVSYCRFFVETHVTDFDSDYEDDANFNTSDFGMLFSLTMLTLQRDCNWSDRSVDKLLKALRILMPHLFLTSSSTEVIAGHWDEVPKSIKQLNGVIHDEQLTRYTVRATCPKCEKIIKPSV